MGLAGINASADLDRAERLERHDGVHDRDARGYFLIGFGVKSE